MSHYDAKVAEELGCSFISVMLQDTEMYRKYRKILLKQYPNKEGMGWPTYLLVTDPDGEFSIEGELKGGMPKETSAPSSPRCCRLDGGWWGQGDLNPHRPFSPSDFKSRASTDSAMPPPGHLRFPPAVLRPWTFRPCFHKFPRTRCWFCWPMSLWAASTSL